MGQSKAVDEFIFNSHGDSVPVVHSPDCVTVQHQVRGDLHDMQRVCNLVHRGKDAGGNDVFSEVFEEVPVYSRAEYVTFEWLRHYPRRYRRCRVCAPDIEERPPSDRRSVKVESLTSRHIGNVFAGIGRLIEIRVTEKGYLLIGDDRREVLAPGAAVEYFK